MLISHRSTYADLKSPLLWFPGSLTRGGRYLDPVVKFAEVRRHKTTAAPHSAVWSWANRLVFPSFSASLCKTGLRDMYAGFPASSTGLQ